MKVSNYVPAGTRVLASLCLTFAAAANLSAAGPLAVAQTHGLLLSSGSVCGVGRNEYAELGDGTYVNRSSFANTLGITSASGIATGWYHSVAVKSDGTVWSWGYNQDGELGDGTSYGKPTPMPLAGLSGFTAVAAGQYHSLALKNDGTVWAWGYNNSGQLGDGTTAERLVPVQVIQLNNVAAIAAGAAYSMALRKDGTVWMWGSNSYGQLGNGTTNSSTSAVQVTGLTNVSAIAAGSLHAMALKGDGTVWDWGYNGSGELGDGSTTYRTTIVSASGLTGITAIAAGDSHSLAVRNDGTIWAWGLNSSGQLGIGSLVNQITPVQVTGLTGLAPATAVGAGSAYSTALLSDGTLKSWGDNSYGQLGNGSTTSALLPVTTQPCSPAVTTTPAADTYRDRITAAQNHTLVATSAGTVLGWGQNEYGELGDGTSINRSTPVTAASLTGVSQVSTGWYHSLAVQSSGAVYSWGYNSDGELGDGTNISKNTAQVVPSLSGITAVAAGQYHSLALRNDGTVWAWGYNGSSQLGDGTNTERLSPVQVIQLTNVTAIAAGSAFSVALRSDGTVWAWGDNNSGQLGDGTLVNKTSAVQVTGLSGVVAIRAGANHTVALKADGTVWTWGYSGNGQLGDGNTGYQTEIVRASGLSGVVAIATGANHTLAVKSDGTVWAWGANGSGQLGDGTAVQKTVPVQTLNLTNAVAVAGGLNHSVVLKSDGTISAWGDNTYGQFGAATPGSSTVPVQTVSSGVLAALPGAVSVSPSSGSGAAQVFTAVYSDPAGAGSLNDRLFLMNTYLGGGGACYVVVNSGGTYLVNDAGNALTGPLTGSTTLSNSQCTLSGAGSSVVNSGTTSTVTLSLTFSSAFTGAKNIYLYADDSTGNSGWQTRGSFTVALAYAPSAVSVSPSSGSGLTQTFTATYSDAAGASVLNRRLFLINSALVGAGACYVQADATGIYLVNDAGSAILAGTLTNNQCTVSDAGSGISNSGLISTVTFAITFKASFAGPKNIYLYADDPGTATGWQAKGTFTVSSGAPATPTADSVSPGSGSGAAQSFTAVFSDGSGAGLLNRRLILINSTLNGAGGCFIQADPTGIYLVNDSGSALSAGLIGGSSVSNSQCTLNGVGTSVVNAGNSSTVTLALVFKPAFAGAKNIYLYDEDTNGNNSGFQLRGTYTVSSTASVPANTSVTPNSGSGASRTFTVVYSDPGGNSLLNRRLFLINSAILGGSACYVQVDPTGIYLVNDAGNALTGPLTPAGVLSNSQCTLNPAGGASVSYSATSTTVVLPITFNASFGGTRNLYMYADDVNGNNTGWQLMGTVTTQ